MDRVNPEPTFPGKGTIPEPIRGKFLDVVGPLGRRKFRDDAFGHALLRLVTLSNDAKISIPGFGYLSWRYGPRGGNLSFFDEDDHREFYESWIA